MALTKEIIEDKIEVIGKYKTVQIKTATIIKEDEVEISRSFDRKVLHPDADVSKESKEVQGVCNAVWSDENKKTYKYHLETLKNA